MLLMTGGALTHRTDAVTRAREAISMRPFCWRRSGPGCIVLLLSALVCPALAQELHFTNYHSSDGLPQVQVLAIHQDRKGFLWIGTYGGLTRFDGVAFRTYSRADGLIANTVTSIAEDAAGRLVVGVNGGVCVRLAQRFRCRGRESGPLGQTTVRLVADTLGGVWVASDAGVVHLDSAGRVRAIPLPAGGLVTALAVDRSGVVWIATAAVLARLQDDRFVPVSIPELHGEQVRVLRAGQRGLLIVTDKDAIEFVDGHARALLALPQQFAGAITDVLVAPDSTLWISTRQGVLVLRNGQTERLTRDNGLVGDDVNTLSGDREGNIWFGTESGLAKLTPGPFRHFTERQGLPSPFVRALAEDARGQIWTGTRNGIAVLDGEGFRTLPGFLGVRVYGIAPLPRRGMLIATREGLVHYDQGIRRRYGVQDGLPDAFVRSLLTDSAGSVWVGTRGGIVRWEGGRIVAVADTLLARANTTAMAHDARGRLWVGTNLGGALIHDSAGTHKLSAKTGLSDETIWALARDAAGRMWVGTNGDGAYRVSPAGSIERFGAAQGLLNAFIWQVLVDHRGRVWFYTSQGIDRLTNATMQHLGRADGLRDLEGAAGASLEDNQGSIWFGTGSGITRYRFADDRGAIASPSPDVVIEGLSAGTQAIPLDRARIPPGAGALRVSYTSPMLRNPEGLRFRYRIVGEEDWSEPTAERSITIAGLSPGKHTFEVLAVDEDGRASQLPARVAVTVLPAFWQAWWFRALMLLSLGGAVAGVPVLRARRLEAERGRLEREVAVRTEQLTEQARRLVLQFQV
jgi:ligand-binding sensor domain-containing protein